MRRLWPRSHTTGEGCEWPTPAVGEREGEAARLCAPEGSSGTALDAAPGSGAASSIEASTIRLFAGSESGPCGLHPIDLSRGEHEHAGILGVVHEVEDRVETRLRSAGARVPAHRAKERGGELR